MSKLIKITVEVETVIRVPDNFTDRDIHLNCQYEIKEGVKEALCNDDYEVTLHSIPEESGLPNQWDGKCLPYTDRTWEGCEDELTCSEVLNDKSN